MNNIFFSIIVPIYNVENYISECINSILNQTYKNFEIIIIDDGSTDNSYYICEKIANSDDRIQLFSQRNQGVSYARNLGIEKANGKYILFVDSDDYINEHTLEILKNKCEETNDDEFLVFGYVYKYKNSEIPCICKPNMVELNEELLETNFIVNGYIGGIICNKVYSKRIIDENNLKFDSNIHYSEDLQFILKYVEYIKKINYIGEKLYYYRMRKNSVNYKFVTKKNASILKLYLMLIEQYKDNQNLKNKLEYKYLINYFLLKKVADKEYVDYQIINREKEILRKNNLTKKELIKYNLIVKRPIIKTFYKRIKNLIRKPYE